MTTTQIDGVSVTTAANVYFDGKCVSHGITFPDGTKKSVGVILPATLTFNTGAPEIMECVAGSCDYMLDGSDTWVTSAIWGNIEHLGVEHRVEPKMLNAGVRPGALVDLATSLNEEF